MAVSLGKEAIAFSDQPELEAGNLWRQPLSAALYPLVAAH